jgi:Zn-dependent protease with chaperone function
MQDTHTAQPDELPARWFDGRSTEPQPAWVRLQGDHLQWRAATDQNPQHCALATLTIGETWPNAPTPVLLPGGGTLWLGDEAAALRRDLAARLTPKFSALRLIRSWRAVAACVVALVALIIWFDRQGAGLAADVVVSVLPRSVDQAIGVRAEELISKQWLATSRVPRERQAALEGRLATAAQQLAPGVPVRLHFARLVNERAAEAGFNAFALPHGTIIVLDGMAEKLSDDELMAVLGHELGHVVHRHGLRAVARGFGLFAAATAVLGDFSGVTATAVASWQTLHYSRDAEREADAYARRVVAQAGLPAAVLVQVWQKMASEEKRDWLSTHPSTEERLRASKGGSTTP